ncbi:hypothetical protein [Aquimarina latercula]|uniref:hypothetical protein n=1 Tax=Aquimarina latercula TaxID=987 RepID=UPI0004255EB1|nr:hypothetical protein [Aquimarina latercula]
MSEVTNLILTCSTGEKEKLILSKINQFKMDNKLFKIVSINDKTLPDAWYGGTKYMECNIFIGAYNYLNLEKLIDNLKSIEWEDPEDVQLIIKQQNDDHFRIINLFQATSSPLSLE